eukprot:TRINITY_DN12684_c10_g1_i2.p1 TRINITY_DN12684_c10_g1~~TRINITY_DN12684_c10_g1_i2.p1  ORF type:complete len:349 (+),score=46.45 TRINITY_DN12684_c10_g1_i2:157-1203(+)
MATSSSAKRDAHNRDTEAQGEQQRPGETYAQYRKRRHRETETVRRGRVNDALATLRELTNLPDKTDQATVLEHAVEALNKANQRISMLEAQACAARAIPTPSSGANETVTASSNIRMDFEDMAHEALSLAQDVDATLPAPPIGESMSMFTPMEDIQLSSVDFDLLTASLITDRMPTSIPLMPPADPDKPLHCPNCNCDEMKAKNVDPIVCPCDELGHKHGPNYLDSKFLPNDVGIMLFNSAFHIVDCNAGLAKLLQLSRDDLVGHSPSDFGIKSGNTETQQAAMRLASGMHHTLVTIEEVTGSKGRRQWVRCSVMALARDPVSGQRCFFGVMQPIAGHLKGAHVVSST